METELFDNIIEWHTANKFAQLAGITSRSARRICRNALEKKRKYKGCSLEVLIVKAQGGNNGQAYEINPESYPHGLLLKWHREEQAKKPVTEAEKKATKKKEIDHESRWEHYQYNQTNKTKDTAVSRHKAITAYFELTNGPSQCKKGEALKLVSNSFNVPASTLRKWVTKVKKLPREDWLPALAPNWNPHKNTAECTPAAWELFKGDYLRLEQPTIKACYMRTRDKAKEEGWVIPSVDTFELWVKKKIPLTTRILMRGGEHELMQLYPYQERSKNDLRSMEWINGDGYQHNVFVRWPDGTIARPKTWFWQDVRTNHVLGWRADLSENSDMIRLAFKTVAETYGIPEHITIDNTRAAANKWMTGGVANRFRFKVKEDDPLGIFPLLGAKVHWTSIHYGKGHGQSKPVERTFGIGGIGELVDKSPACAGAYTGKDTQSKPDNYGSKAIDLKDFLKALQHGVNQWNREPKRRTTVCRHQLSYEQAFNESYRSSVVRKLTAAQKHMLLLMAEKVKVSKSGTVTLEAGKGFGMGANRYGSEDLMEHQGKYVVIRFDPQDLHGAVYCYELNNHYIGKADCLSAAGFGDKEAGRIHNKARKQFVKAKKAAAKAEEIMTTMEVASQMADQPDPEPPEAKTIQPIFNAVVSTKIEDAANNDELLRKAMGQ
ncbi:MAG: transposase domain-containing protein [Methylococcales bacterium]